MVAAMMAQLEKPRVSVAPRLQRAVGNARVALIRRDGTTRLRGLYQQGAAKVRFVGPAADQAVLINTAGGLAEGDRFAWSVALEAGARCSLTTQACEKVYRGRTEGPADPAEVRVTLEVGPGGRLDWLPQETILFDCAGLKRELQADLAEDAELLAVEAVILGRRAMGERVSQVNLHDRWRVRRHGRPIFADDLKLRGALAPFGEAEALLARAGAFALVLLAASHAEQALDAVRAVLPFGAAASAFDGKLICRILAVDGLALRRALVPVLTVLRRGQALPRLWSV